MATKKNSPKKVAAKKQKSTMIKIAETLGQVAGEISVKKDQFADIASHAIEAVKSKLHDITAPKKAQAKKVVKKAVKKAAPKKVAKAAKKAVAKKVINPVAKKAATTKKVVTKTVKKAAPVKKAAKKAIKKVTGKK